MLNKKNNKLVVISAPSGTGKTTLVNLLVEKNSEFKFSISHTTRKKRPNETDGKDYFFIDSPKFNELISREYFAEYAKVFGNWYGTSKKNIKSNLEKGEWVILELDWQGASQIRKNESNCLSIFLLPPTKRHLSDRLNSRSTDTKDEIRQRLEEAVSDMSHWTEFDYVVINDDINKAFKKIENILRGKGEESSISNMPNRKRIMKIIEST